MLPVSEREHTLIQKESSQKGVEEVKGPAANTRPHKSGPSVLFL